MHGDPLTRISDPIDFERIGQVLSDLYEHYTENGGVPDYDTALVSRILPWQYSYDLVSGRFLDRIACADAIMITLEEKHRETHQI